MQPSDDDDLLYAQDLARSAPSPLTYAAAASCALAGVAFVFLGIQTRALLIRLSSLGELATVTMLTGGFVLAVVATQLLRLRLWAAISGVVVSALLALGGAVWLIVSMANGLFSALAWLCPAACVASAVTSAVAAPGCKRAGIARRRMSARSEV